MKAEGFGDSSDEHMGSYELSFAIIQQRQGKVRMFTKRCGGLLLLGDFKRSSINRIDGT